MKTTLDLPDELVLQVKLYALRNGQKLREAFGELLRKGMADPAVARPAAAPQPRVVINSETGLPVILGAKQPTDDPVSSGRIKDILLDQEVEWYRQATR